MLTRKLTHLEAHAIAHRLHQAGEVVAGVVAELAGMEDSVTSQPQAAEPKGLTSGQQETIRYAAAILDQEAYHKTANDLRALLANGE